jgi:tocopherol O-methyltransferase
MSRATESKANIEDYEIPEPGPFISFNALKDRIRHHYELASDYYYSLWYVTQTSEGTRLPRFCTYLIETCADESRGEHIHHGYFLTPSDTKEKAQEQLIDLLLQKSALPKGNSVLDFGCGIGGTSRWLAKNHDCNVTGVTISGRQVDIARRLTSEAGGVSPESSEAAMKLGEGSVRFIELDAEKMGDFFTAEKFDCVWISEAMSHLPNKELFFRNAAFLLKDGGKLVVADWFKDGGLAEKQFKDDISPIEGMYRLLSRTVC